MSSATGTTFNYNFKTLKDGTLSSAVVVTPKALTKNRIAFASGSSFSLRCKGVLSPKST